MALIYFIYGPASELRYSGNFETIFGIRAYPGTFTKIFVSTASAGIWWVSFRNGNWFLFGVWGGVGQGSLTELDMVAGILWLAQAEVVPLDSNGHVRRLVLGHVNGIREVRYLNLAYHA